MTPLHKKLRLRENMRIGVVNKPGDFDQALQPLPTGCRISRTFSQSDDVIFWFVKTIAELEAGREEVLDALSDSNMIWIGYPKGTSGMQTDLNRDIGWDSLMKSPDVSFVAFIAFNEIWSTFCIRRKTEADRKREAKPVVREIFMYADSATKTITLPEDMNSMFAQHKNARKIFEGLSFSNRREYVEWVVTAKRDETRRARVEGTVEKLLKGLKNPAGR